MENRKRQPTGATGGASGPFGRRAAPVPGRRRALRHGAQAVAAGALVLGAPALAQGALRLRIGVQDGIAGDFGQALGVALADRIAALSGGAVTLGLETAPPGDAGLVAVARGDLDGIVGSGADWLATDPGFGLFAACPLGLDGLEFAGWIHQGGGQQIWDALGAEHGVKPMLLGDAGGRPAGWFDSAPVGAADFQGKVMATYGLGGLAVQALGGEPAPPGARAWGACSAGLRTDVAAGLPGRFAMVMTPALWQPHSAVTLAWSAGVWQTLPPATVAMVEAAVRACAEAATARALADDLTIWADLRAAGQRHTPLTEDLFSQIAVPVHAAVADAMVASARPFLWEDYQRFLSDAAGWSAIGEGAFSVARADALGTDG